MATGSERLAIDGGPKAVTNALPPWPKFSDRHETHTFTCFAFPTFSAEDVKQIAAGLVKVIEAYS